METKRLVFLDESGMRLDEIPRYGWGARGKKVFDKAKHMGWTHVTMLGAIAADGVRAVVNIETSTTSEVFRAFVIQQLVPTLKKGDCVVMDNLSYHKDKLAVEAITRAEATILYLPPYSPDRNPIEKFWAKLKEFVRRQITCTRDMFNEAVASAIAHTRTTDIVGWIGHCGYPITSN